MTAADSAARLRELGVSKSHPSGMKEAVAELKSHTSFVFWSTATGIFCGTATFITLFNMHAYGYRLVPLKIEAA